MDVVFGAIVVIVFLLIALGPILRRWIGPLLQRWMLGKMEDNMRRMAGMPTRKEEKRARRQAQRRQSRGAAAFRNAAGNSRRRGSYRAGANAMDYLQVYAEDVEFTEIKEFSHESKTSEIRYKVEQQVEDVEFTETKSNNEG